MLRASRYDTVLRVTRYVPIRAPVLTILLSLPNYHITTYWITLGYTTVTVRVDRAKESAVDKLSTIATVGPFRGGINLIRLNKKCKVHTHDYVRTQVAMRKPRSRVTSNESNCSPPKGGTCQMCLEAQDS